MRVVPASLLCLAVTLASCAQDVGDIDRTQPNLLPKAMFRDHAWFLRQTVTDVPPTSSFSFVGETSTLEIVNWEIQQEYLVGYRAYEKVPGSDSDADHSQGTAGAQPVREGRGSGRDPGQFKGNPVVAYEILDHQGLHNYHVADDLRTILFVVHAKGGGKELIIVRWVVYEGHLYISPEKAPDPKTGIFKPWILRTKVK